MQARIWTVSTINTNVTLGSFVRRVLILPSINLKKYLIKTFINLHNFKISPPDQTLHFSSQGQAVWSAVTPSVWGTPGEASQTSMGPWQGESLGPKFTKVSGQCFV